MYINMHKKPTRRFSSFSLVTILFFINVWLYVLFSMFYFHLAYFYHYPGYHNLKSGLVPCCVCSEVFGFDSFDAFNINKREKCFGVHNTASFL